MGHCSTPQKPQSLELSRRHRTTESIGVPSRIDTDRLQPMSKYPTRSVRPKFIDFYTNKPDVNSVSLHILKLKSRSPETRLTGSDDTSTFVVPLVIGPGGWKSGKYIVVHCTIEIHSYSLFSLVYTQTCIKVFLCNLHIRSLIIFLTPLSHLLSGRIPTIILKSYI